MNRLERVRRMLFASGERPITALELAQQTGVRTAGVRHVLRVLERQGVAECLRSARQCNAVTNAATNARRSARSSALVWRWKD